MKRTSPWIVAPLLAGVAVLLPGLCARAEPPAPQPAPQPAPAPETASAHLAPSGMVWVDVGAGKPRVGTPADQILKMVGKRKDVLAQFIYETPVHDVTLVPYFLDQFEVTNAQYKVWLDATAKTTYKTGSSALANLEEIASFYAYGDAKKGQEVGDKTSWGQVYELNRDTLQKNLSDLKGQKDKFRLAALPPDIELVVYSRRLPELWFAYSGVLEGDAGPNQPVRGVSYLEAEGFAEWAGKHVPTEDEWEFAARGPELRNYPWGNDWKEGVSGPQGQRIIEDRCNWLDLGVVSAKTHEPTTVEVDKIPEGRSWCGAYHMLGNVSEWTSSWFNPYPGWTGSTDPLQNRWAAYHGDDFVKVIRGGSCGDRERLALRLAYRNFVGIERFAPPRPQNHFSYTGFRCAYYLTPALDRLEPAIARLLRPKKIRREQVAVARFGGAAAVRFAAAGAAVENHVHVTGKASAVLVAPMSEIFQDKEKRPRASDPSGLLALAPDEEHPDPVAIGVFHTDIGLSKVKLRDPKAPVAETGGRRERGKKKEGEMPATIEGSLPPDTYVLGLAYGYVGVYQSNLEFVAFLDKASITMKRLQKDEAPPSTKISVDTVADIVKCSLWIPIGGKGGNPTVGVTITWSFITESGALDKAGSWRATAGAP